MSDDLKGVSADHIDKGDMVYKDGNYIRLMHSLEQLRSGNLFIASSNALPGHDVTYTDSKD